MVRLFIRKHMAVYSFAALIVIVGSVAYFQLPRESSPEIKQPYIFVTTTYVGVSAADIESLVTQPIERELDGMEGLYQITSESRQSLSFIFVEFTSDVTVEEALRRVKDRVDLAKAKLPADAEDPAVQEFNASNWPVYTLVLSHPDGVEVIDWAAKRFQDELKRMPGVLEVDVTGRPTKEVAIALDPARLEKYGFSIQDVVQAVQRENMSIPGGTLRNAAKNFSLSVTGEIEDPRQFEDVFVQSGDARVRLRELGTARFQSAEAETISRLNGTPAITLSIKKRIGENIIDMVESVERKVDGLRAVLPAGTIVVNSYDESRYIRDMIFDLENNMFSGFVLVLLVTIFFLGFRNSLFVSLAIPFSMLMSFFILQAFGITLNMIVLFSLILALGMLVDNGIVIVENIFRHAGMGKSRKQASVDGASEVAGPIIASTLTTILAFFPIIFMPGIMGDFMKYLPITVIAVLGSSLLVALAINPTFCASFLRIDEKQRRRISEGSGGFHRIQSWYVSFLRHSIRHSRVSVLGVFLVVLLGFTLYGMFGRDMLFFPYQDPTRARVRIEAPAGTPVRHTDQVVRELEEIVRASPASMENYEGIAGSDGNDTGSHRGSVNVTYVPYAEREISGQDAVRELQKRTRSVIGAVVKVEESEDGPPTGDDVSYEVTGDDYAVLGEISERIFSILQEYPAFREVETDYEASRPEYRISVDRGQAAYYGLSTSQVAETVRSAINGSTIGTYRQDEEEYDIVIRYQEDARSSLASLRNVGIVTMEGMRVPLSTIADIDLRSSLGVIKRRNLNRAVNVYANFDPAFDQRQRVLGEIAGRVAEIEQTLPPGYQIGPGAGLDLRDESTTFLMQAFLVAIFLIFVVLVAQFNSVADPFIIMFSVFLSLGGVFWGFLLTGQQFVIIMSGIGCIALAGVAVNNCIVLVDYTHNLIRVGTPWREAVVEAGRTRLRPVLLTAMTTVLALVPMAFGVSFNVRTFSFIMGSESGDFWKAFAWTMLFGLTFATVMTLVVVPSLLHIKYAFLERHGKSFEAH